MKKKILLMLPCIAAVATATFVGTKSLKANASESNDLLMANVEALSAKESYVDNEVAVRYGSSYANCYHRHTYYSPCNDKDHDKTCEIKTERWDNHHELYHCMRITADRYKNGSFTLCQTNDLNCNGSARKTAPEDKTEHTVPYILNED